MIPSFCPKQLSGTIYWNGELWGVSGYDRNQEFRFGHIKLEMTIRHLTGTVKWAVKHVLLELSHDFMTCGLLRVLGEGRSQKRERIWGSSLWKSGTKVLGNGKSQDPVLPWRHWPKERRWHSGYGVIKTEKVFPLNRCCSVVVITGKKLIVGAFGIVLKEGSR